VTAALARAWGALRAAVRAALGLRSGRRRHGDILVDGRWTSIEDWERQELGRWNPRRRR
jgi:hypothetical protein